MHKEFLPAGMFSVKNCPFLVLQDSHSKPSGNFPAYLLRATALESFSPHLHFLSTGEDKTDLPLEGLRQSGQVMRGESCEVPRVSTVNPHGFLRRGQSLVHPRS